MIRIRVCALIVQDNSILMVEHTKNGRSYWLLPGGGVEQNETLPEAVSRELLEETSLNVNVQEMIFICESISEERHLIHACFKANVVNGKLKVNPDERLSDARFFTAEELTDLEIRPNIKEFLVKKLNNPDERPENHYFGNLWA